MVFDKSQTRDADAAIDEQSRRLELQGCSISFSVLGFSSFVQASAPASAPALTQNTSSAGSPEPGHPNDLIMLIIEPY